MIFVIVHFVQLQFSWNTTACSKTFLCNFPLGLLHRHMFEPGGQRSHRCCLKTWRSTMWRVSQSNWKDDDKDHLLSRLTGHRGVSVTLHTQRHAQPAVIELYTPQLPPKKILFDKRVELNLKWNSTDCYKTMKMLF